SPRRLKRKEAQPRFDASFDEAVILFNNVVEVFHPSEVTTFWQLSCGFEFTHRLWIGSVFVNGDHPRRDRMSCSQRLLEKLLGCCRITCWAEQELGVLLIASPLLERGTSTPFSPSHRFRRRARNRL